MPIKHRWPLCGKSNPDWCTTPGPTGINDSADPNNTIMLRRSSGLRGAIKMAEEGEIVLARAGGPRTLRGLHRTRIRTYNEVNMVGSFPFKGSPWKNTAEKLAYMHRGKWYPADDELRIFANSKIPKKNSEYQIPKDAWMFLNVLYSFPAKRFNLFTHGTALSGYVEKGHVHFERGKIYHLLGTWYYTAMNPGFVFEGKGKWRTLKDLRSVMPSGAKLIIYGCNSGSKRKEIKRLSKLLGIVVQGFSKKIGYHPVMSKDGKHIINWRYSHGETGKIVDDYHKLKPDISSANIK